MIAALFVMKRGCYIGLDGVDPWDEDRDARLYDGPHPVIAHPPCERWGRYFGGSPATWPRLKLGDDKGCFAAALKAVRQWGGVLEHPADSKAWAAFNLNAPSRGGGWLAADFHGGWTCRVEQGAYGHRARKATWLYACGVDLPELRWGTTEGDFVRARDGRQMRREIRTGACQRLSKKQRKTTPIEFRDLLISIASTAMYGSQGLFCRWADRRAVNK